MGLRYVRRLAEGRDSIVAVNVRRSANGCGEAPRIAYTNLRLVCNLTASGLSDRWTVSTKPGSLITKCRRQTRPNIEFVWSAICLSRRRRRRCNASTQPTNWSHYVSRPQIANLAGDISGCSSLFMTVEISVFRQRQNADSADDFAVNSFILLRSVIIVGRGD